MTAGRDLRGGTAAHTRWALARGVSEAETVAVRLLQSAAFGALALARSAEARRVQLVALR